jgi:hypothetical protein
VESYTGAELLRKPRESIRKLIRHTGSGESELATRIASWAAGAVEIAKEDAARGLSRIDELIELCAGIPELAQSAVSLGYNRAAALRELDRPADADAAYRAVIDEFATHPDPTVAWWVGLALDNWIIHVGETRTSDAAAEVVPALVNQLREHVARHDDASLGRRLRLAMRTEIELFESLDDAERAEESWARLYALQEPAVPQVLAVLDTLDPTAAVDDVTPRFAMDRQDVLAVSLVEELDDILDVVRALADAPQEELIELVSPHHKLVSGSVVGIITAVKDGLIPGAESSEDRDRIERGLDVLFSLIDYLFEHRAYPLGSGPFETLLDAVDRSISMSDALEVARSVEAVGALSLPYVYTLVEECVMPLLLAGQWQRAARLQLLVLAAAERLPNCREGRDIVSMARFGWLRVGRFVLINVPNGRVLFSARDAGERVLRTLEQDKYDPRRLAEVLYELAALHIEPHAGQTEIFGTNTAFVGGLRRWYDRGSEYDLDPVEVSEDVSEGMPAITEMVDIGEQYLRRFLACSQPAQQGLALTLMWQLHDLRAALGMKPGDEQLGELAARMAEAVDPDSYPQMVMEALRAQQSLGGQPDPAAIDRLLSRSISEIAEQAGTEAATGVLISAGQLLRPIDPSRARRLFADAEEYIRGLHERDRMKVLRVQSRLLFDLSDLDAAPDPAATPEVAIASLLARAKAADWPDDRTALALLALTVQGSLDFAANTAEELAWLANLPVIPQLFPDVFTGHNDAMAYKAASWYVDFSARAHERGDWEHALRGQAAACEQYLTLAACDAAMESLTLIARAVQEAAGVGLAAVSAEVLGPLAVRCENLIGARATAVLQDIWSQVVGAVTNEDDLPALFACLQLAKGARFTDAKRAGVRFDARTDEEAAHLLERISELGNDPVPDLELDAVTLVTPYTERLDVGDVSLARQRENLERTFDATVQRHLTGDQTSSPLTIDTVLDLLPPDTVLLYIYLSHSEDGGRSMLSLVGTTERLALVRNQWLDAENARLQAEIRIGDRVRLVDALGWTTHQIRTAVLTDPGPVRPVSRVHEAALIDGLTGLLGPVAELLQERYAAGRRHLVIVPHGPLHFAPLHLLYLDGKPLAETFSVTYLPSLALLEGAAATQAGERTLTSVGLSFADGPLSPIPEAVEEATMVAAEFGTTALLDEQATEEAVFAALGSANLFHIATHGVHNVAAPAFQNLYVADEMVSAHELLRLDLSGLELVALSACETALGRFDAADNLRGIPASLLLRGASAIIGTMWPVETRTSRDFFTTLYRELGRGSCRLDAFTQAQRATRAAHPQYRDWGAFYYTGAWG